MAEVDASSKFQIIRFPALPGTCVACSKSADGETDFVDFNLNLDWYGAVVFCIDCAREMVTVLDYCPVADREAVENEVALQEMSILELQDQNERLRNAIDSLADLRGIFLPNSGSILGVDESTATGADSESDSDE